MKKTDNKQNLLTGFLVIFVVTLGLSSCGTNEEETNIKQEVRVYNWSDYIADSTIREFEKEGFKITKVIYGKDRWVLVTTKDSSIKKQKWFKSKLFPDEDIETNTIKG